MAIERSDIHRPSAIVPEDYEYVAQEYAKVEYSGIADFLLSERAVIEAHRKRTGGTYSGHEHGGNCMVCGAAAIYTVLFYHSKTNSYVRMGQDCARKCEIGDPKLFEAFKKYVHDALERKAGKAKAEAILKEKGLEAAWTLFLTWCETLEKATDKCVNCGFDNRFHRRDCPWYEGTEEARISDIVGRLVKYGSVSEKQVDFVKSMLNRISTRAERAAKIAAERAAALDCPAGRIQIEGQVLTVKTVPTDFGNIQKMLVKHVVGWTVWGTVPNSISVIDEPGGQRLIGHGDRVKFVATVEVSKEDPKHGFFKRPTNAEIVKEVSNG